MQHDIEDAADWAVKEGVADGERLAILGASFGGYCAVKKVCQKLKNTKLS